MLQLTAKSIFTWTLIALSALFILQNLVMVNVTFLFWNLSLPRALMMAIMIGIGFVIGWVFAQHRASKT